MRRYYYSGFTLVEVLVALAIFSLAILGPIMAAYRSAQVGVLARDEFIASFLAQDALEYVRYMVMVEALEGKTETDQFTKLAVCHDTLNFGKKCTIDTRMAKRSSPANLCVGTCPNLQIDTVTGEYGYGGANMVPTPFVREVTIKSSKGWGPGGNIASTTEFQVISTVHYGPQYDRHSVQISTLITDWRRK